MDDPVPPDAHGVDTINLQCFRNYEALSLDLAEGFNVLSGPNGQGKTNFLEALYLLATTRLLRGIRDSEAVREGSQRAVVSAELLHSGTRLGITLEAGVRKRASLNGLSVPRASDLLGRLPCVCVSSLDLSIVSGEPAERRLFLDLELSSLFPAYLRHLAVYKRALDQRNALLKDSREWIQPADLFEPWEEQMAHHGVALREMRRVYLERLSPATADAHAKMGSGERLDVQYVSKDPNLDEASLRQALGATRGADVGRGTSGIGPHRDDVAITIEGREARLYGSQGQQRTSVIALKLATFEIAREELGASPLLLLDDIFSDLDENRRRLLVDLVLSRAGQVVLTCTEPEIAGEQILSKARLYRVREGRVLSQ